GTDQLFNIMAGRHLQRAYGEKALVAVCTPLLIGTDGALKMSKSVGNSINLDLAPSDMYGKLMSIPDSLIVNYYTLVTDVPTPELEAIEKGLAQRSLSPMETKKRLAHSVVEMLNDAAIADAAQEEFERVFQRREDPEDSAIEVPWSDLPLASDLAVADHEARVHLTRLIASKLDMSMNQSRRLLEDGAVAVDGQVTKTTPVTVRDGTMIRVGRHRFMRIIA
ncbi:MAG TPA: tyrosine--tRNA ligase, partial [Dehalococcoidia bacterium]|nr:tyrosine--tRNA ligase [Dehalococcoidia bacterium]